MDKNKKNKWPKNRWQVAKYFSMNGKRVLDIGCAGGQVLYDIKDNFNEMFGIEIDVGRKSSAEEKLKSLNSNILLHNIEKPTSFEDEYFDQIICLDVIEHIPDFFSAIKEITRILKKNGILILVTPNIADIRRRMILLTGKFPSTSAKDQGFLPLDGTSNFDGGHLHYFTFSMLVKLLKKNNYSTIRKYGFGRFGILHNIYPELFSPSCCIVAVK